jgi:hypothetical protein
MPIFAQFLSLLKAESDKHKSVLVNISDEIEKKKMNQYAWYTILRDSFSQHAAITKDFSDRCERVPKEDKAEQMNRYLNMGE